MQALSLSLSRARGCWHVLNPPGVRCNSGGEWISSVALEDIAMGCPGVLHAAVIGVPHPKWAERPLLVVMRKADAAGEALTGKALLEYIKPRCARWWLPDDVVFVDEMPLTATGKILKRKLRDHFHSHVWTTAAPSAKL